MMEIILRKLTCPKRSNICVSSERKERLGTLILIPHWFKITDDTSSSSISVSSITPHLLLDYIVGKELYIYLSSIFI